MDIYYHSDRFRQLLRRYEALQHGDIGELPDPEELTDVAEYYHTVGEDGKAMEAADYAVRMYPTATAPVAFKSRMALLTDDNPQLAGEIAETIVDKSDLDYLYLKAEIMVAGGDAAAADRFLQAHYDETVDPDDLEDYILDVAALFSDYEETDYAEKWLKRSTMTDDRDYKELHAHILRNHGRYEESEAILNDLLDTDPYSGPYWNQLAQNQFLRDDIQDSITSSEYSIAINPDDEEAVLNKANGLFTLGNYEESLKFYERYKQLCPHQDTSIIDVTIGHIRLMQGQAVEAQRCYRRALSESKNKPLTLVHIGISAFDNGYVEYAYRIFINLLPETDDEWDIGFAYLARCCYELKKEKEYKLFLRKAVERNPEECVEVLSDLFPEGTSPQDYLTAGFRGQDE
ncbi:tetratricopeptide repeat protein [Prevotella denticola]|uniref:tetratricopeptide repeat protein n=1 Tax=Prevotella denticola TaxID=28129 RepID=UPI001C5CEB38|nr:hypothetical protein [Prevotella denticola]MBW4897507.1 hypothetical protein [Prevotella denticola]